MAKKMSEIGPPSEERGRVSLDYTGRYQVALVMQHITNLMGLGPKDARTLVWIVGWYITGNYYDDRKPESPLDQRAFDELLGMLSARGRSAALKIFTLDDAGWVIRWPVPSFARRPAIPEAVRALVLQRDGHRCVWCGATEQLEIDHVVPYCEGGPGHPSNLQTLCKPCNLRKGGRRAITR